MRTAAVLLAIVLMACGSNDAGGNATGLTAPDASAPDPGGDEAPCTTEPGTTLVYDGESHEVSEVAVTCRAEGVRARLMVVDSLWNAGIDRASVDAFMQRFESETPAGAFDPTRGIIDNLEAVFGELDSSSLPDGKLAIYVVDSGGAGDGYLCSWCDSPQLHLDKRLLDPVRDEALSVAAHETYHLLHRAYDADEEVWIDESLAEAAMTATGYFTDDLWLDDFVSAPDRDWGPGGVGFGGFHYGAGLLWGTFLYERGGAALMRAITREPENGWEGLDAALASVGEESAFSLFLEMAVAMAVNRPELGHGFSAFDVGEVASEASLSIGTSTRGDVRAGGIDVYRLVGPGALAIEVRGEGIGARAAHVGEDVVVVDPVGGATLTLASDDEAFLVVSAQAEASYEISVD